MLSQGGDTLYKHLNFRYYKQEFVQNTEDNYNLHSAVFAINATKQWWVYHKPGSYTLNESPYLEMFPCVHVTCVWVGMWEGHGHGHWLPSAAEGFSALRKGLQRHLGRSQIHGRCKERMSCVLFYEIFETAWSLYFWSIFFFSYILSTGTKVSS